MFLDCKLSMNKTISHNILILLFILLPPYSVAAAEVDHEKIAVVMGVTLGDYLWNMDEPAIKKALLENIRNYHFSAILIEETENDRSYIAWEEDGEIHFRQDSPLPDTFQQTSYLLNGSNLLHEGELFARLTLYYKAGSNTNKVLLSAGERAYLDSTIFHRQLSYGWCPFNLKDGDGNVVGLSEDYWALIRSKLELNEKITGQPVLFGEILKSMQNGRIDIYPSASGTKDRQAYAVFSERYEKFPIAIAAHKTTEFIFNASVLEGKVVAVGRNYSAYHLMKARYPGIKFLQVENTKEALEQVATGRAYAAIDILPVIQHQVDRLSNTDIKLSGITDVQFPVQIMIRKEHARLLPLINRAINSITYEERASIHQKWMMRDVVSVTDYTLLWQTLAGVLLLVTVILFWNWRLAKEIDRRKQIEEQLRKLSRAVEYSHHAIIISDLNGIIEYINPAFTQSTGYTSKEAIGQNPRILKSDHQDDAFYQLIWNTLREGKVWQGDICNKRKNGTLYWQSMTISPIKDRADKITHYVAIARDVTDHIIAEQEKEKIAEQQQRSKRLESIGVMAGGVAHDLNNILAGIVSYPELLLYDLPQDSKMRKPLEAIQDSGKRAATVVADLLTVARGIATEKKEYNLNALIREYLSSPEGIKLKSLHLNVTFQQQLDAEHATILCSEVHLKKCIMNLVINASEAIVDQGVVTISTRNESLSDTTGAKLELDAGQYMVISICDTGSGISENDLKHIFEPFYTKKHMGRSGTGLGLTIVWNTIKDHNGRIFVEATDQGTCFQVYFSVSSTSEQEQTHSNVRQELTGHNEHILVVDDEPQLRDIAEKILQHLKYKVDSVSSGELAVKFVKETKVDLIVLDMLMEPGMNGRKTYEEILKLNPAQRAIVASGFSESEDVTATIQLGANEFIKKPYTTDSLGRAVKVALNN